MGVDITFYGVYGVFISCDKLFETTEQVTTPSCRHSVIERAGKYCSACGKEVKSNTYNAGSDYNNALIEELWMAAAVEVNENNGRKGFLFGIIHDLSIDTEKRIQFEDTDPIDVATKINEELGKLNLKTPIPAVLPSEVRFHMYVDIR